jgi:sterile alpha motif and leucine zipper-containing kinase AZK
MVFDFSRFNKVRPIGKSTHGTVNLWQDDTSDALIVVKDVLLDDSDFTEGTIKEKVLLEVQSLMKFRHPYVVPLLGYGLDIGHKLLQIAMPYVGSDSLKTVLESPNDHGWFTPTAKTIIIVGIVIGMHFVHYGGIIHRDLKPENILLDPISHSLKIADFGLSRQANVNPAEREGATAPLSIAPITDKAMAGTGPAGTPLYMAPEAIQGQGYSTKANVFSFGILLYEIATGKRPCQGCGDSSGSILCGKVAAGYREEIPDIRKIPDGVEPFTAGLISRCWDEDPNKQPTFETILDELWENHFQLFGDVNAAEVVASFRSVSPRSRCLNAN